MAKAIDFLYMDTHTTLEVWLGLALVLSCGLELVEILIVWTGTFNVYMSEITMKTIYQKFRHMGKLFYQSWHQIHMCQLPQFLRGR